MRTGRRLPTAERPVRARPRLLARLLAALWLALAAQAAAAAMVVSAAMPAGFADLAGRQQVVADFSYGGRPIGQFAIEFWPGGVRLLDPDRVVAAIPGIADTAAVRAALAVPTLDPNARFVCDPGPGCAPPAPDVAAVAFDSRRYRVAVFINPRLLAVRPAMQQQFLTAAGGWSLVDQAAGAVAGGGGRTVYDLRNRAILAHGDARLLAEGSYSSGSGASLDTLAAQLDRHDLRYAAGLYYAAGVELTGRRRIVGVGVASQYDTRTDRDLITGTPLVVFLGQRARVDLLVGGRLMSSVSYEAGNQTLDTSALPEGSYAVDIHVQEASGAERTERRFFSKTTRVPPPGKTMLFADAGMLAADRPGSILAITRTPFAEAGMARRLGNRLAWDATVLGTNRKVMAQLGATALMPSAQARIAALVSQKGDLGVIAQLNSSGARRLGYAIDIRRVSTRNGPLIPIGDRITDPFGLDLEQQQAQLAANSYTQAVATLSWRLDRAQLGLSGYYRRDRGEGSSYAVGPTIHWDIVRTQRLAFGFDGSVAQTDRGRTVALGLALRLTGPRSSLGARLGAQTGVPRHEDRVGAVAGVDGSIQRSIGSTDVTASGSALGQQGGGALVQAGIEARGPLGIGAASLVRRIDGDQSTTQYGASMQTSFVVGRHVVALGTRQQADAVIAVSVRGDRVARFDVLVDGSPRGRIRGGGRLTIAVSPYRRYAVRIRPVSGGLVAFDSRARTVDAFPGTVAALAWKASPQLAMFGRLVHPDGSPVATADIRAGDDIAATDDRGWFQLQTAADADLAVREAGGRMCRATLQAKPAASGYTPLGTVTCRP